MMHKNKSAVIYGTTKRNIKLSNKKNCNLRLFVTKLKKERCQMASSFSYCGSILQKMYCVK